jgi:hypothetical protein
MKKNLILIGIAFLSACQSLAGNAFTSTPLEATKPLFGTSTEISVTQIPSFTSSSTSVPTDIPHPTETATPVPPKSFDPAVVRTFTPGTPSQCPKENPGVELDVKSPWQSSGSGDSNQQETEKLLAFLNSGRRLRSILPAFEKDFGGPIPPFFKIQDVTGDNVPELIYPFGIWIDVFGCKDGKYELLFTDINESGTGDIDIIDISDIKFDGLPEVTVYFGGCMGDRCPMIRVYEWNGKDFQNLIANPYSIGDGCSSLSVAPYDVKIKDIDNNGTKEIMMSNTYKPWPDNDFPYRKETRICMWNGQNSVVYKSEFDAPYYRFQAVQDGDGATLAGDYSKAAVFYQRTISDKKLKWFTQDRKGNDFWIYHSKFFPSLKEPTPTASPDLVEDPNEYPNLAAYAYYRMMLLYILQGNTVKAATTFSTLQDQFSTGSPGNYFAQIASIFWQEYQSSASVQNSCRNVVAYVQEHPLPVEYLGDWDHGVHSINYTAEAICPFK